MMLACLNHAAWVCTDDPVLVPKHLRSVVDLLRQRNHHRRVPCHPDGTRHGSPKTLSYSVGMNGSRPAPE
jgi:hypothetical protein